MAILEDTEKADSLLIMSADQIIIRLHHISLKEQWIIDLSYSRDYFFENKIVLLITISLIIMIIIIHFIYYILLFII